MSSSSLVRAGLSGAPFVSLFLPVSGRIRATAILVDDFGDESSAAEEILRALTRLGVAVARTGVEQDFGTVLSALEKEHGAAALLIGHGASGARLLERAFDVPSARAVAVIGVPAEESTTTRLGRLRRPLLVMHGPLDPVVDVSNALRILEPAHHPKSYLSLDRADHLLSDGVDARYAADALALWADRYLPPLPRDEGHTHGASARIGRDRFRTEIIAGGHRVLADEPESLEGTDHGPTPFELLLAGLGGCTAITIRMYADRKSWPLDAVHVDVTHERVAPQETDCDIEAPGKIDLITTYVRLEGDLDDAQHARLMDIAEKCPVHRTLKGTPCLVTVDRTQRSP